MFPRFSRVFLNTAPRINGATPSCMLKMASHSRPGGSHEACHPHTGCASTGEGPALSHRKREQNQGTACNARPQRPRCPIAKRLRPLGARQAEPGQGTEPRRRLTAPNGRRRLTAPNGHRRGRPRAPPRRALPSPHYNSHDAWRRSCARRARTACWEAAPCARGPAPMAAGGGGG